MKRFMHLSMIAVLACSGCTLIKAIVKNKHDSDQEAMEAKGDYEGLAEICRERGRESACKAKRRIGLARLEATTCATLEKDIEAYYINHAGTKAGDLALVRKFEACGKLPVLYGKSFRIRWLSEALTEADDQGAEVFEPLLEYLDSGGELFAGRPGATQAARLTRWLVNAGKGERCGELDRRFANIAPETRGEFMWVYRELACADQALNRAQEFLESNRPNDRAQGCEALGEFGDESALEKLGVLAASDPYKADREVRTSQGHVAVETFHPVRERCLAAAGRLRVRL